VCAVGGISTAKKIAALAEARHLSIVPHNPLSPVSTAACLQVAASIPNLAIQEYPDGQDEPPQSEIVTSLPVIQEGFMMIPNAPGIGVELAPDAAAKFPPKPRAIGTRLNRDGSVVDQ
jgi:galactonate dehydratase